MNYIALFVAGLASCALLANVGMPRWVCIASSLVVPCAMILMGVV